MKTFGEVAAAARKAKALTLEKVAKAVGSHKGYISGIENGKVNAPSPKILKKMCKLLGLDEFKSMLRVTIEKSKDNDVREYLEAVCQDEFADDEAAAPAAAPTPAKKPTAMAATG